MDDVYAITSDLIGNPQASVEFWGSWGIEEAIPHASYSSLFFCGF